MEPELKYKFEYGKRSVTCINRCGREIGKDELRVGSRHKEQKNNKQIQWEWRHWSCIPDEVMHDIVITNFGKGCLERPDLMLTTSGVADLTDCPLRAVDEQDMYVSILQYCEKQASNKKGHRPKRDRLHHSTGHRRKDITSVDKRHQKAQKGNVQTTPESEAEEVKTRPQDPSRHPPTRSQTPPETPPEAPSETPPKRRVRPRRGQMTLDAEEVKSPRSRGRTRKGKGSVHPVAEAPQNRLEGRILHEIEAVCDALHDIIEYIRREQGCGKMSEYR